MRLELAPLTEAEVADQLTGISGSRPPDDVVERIFERSDGNPFFVEELAGRGADAGLPATLRDVLAGRLATLSPMTRGVISRSRRGGARGDARADREGRRPA